MKVIFQILLALLVAQAAFAGEKVYFYDTDPAGTPLVMTDSSGNVVWRADYKPFGEENSVTGTAANDLRFVGKVKDEETGLDYFGARYHDPRTGRFIAPDPVRAVDEKTSKTNEKMLLNPQLLNTYAYGINNPYSYVDPDGLAPILTAENPWNNQRFSGGSIGAAAGEGGFARPPMRGAVAPSSTMTSRIDPSTVRFTQDSARFSFKGGGNIDELASGLKKGNISPQSVPPIRLVERDGQLYTLDNRRLEAFRRAGVEVPYRMATPKEDSAEGWKFTTRNNGTSIRIRGE